MKPTRKEAILQHCWQCVGFYQDGKLDCENPRCPLYSYMPYGKMEPNLDLFQYSAVHKGRQLKTKLADKITEKQRENGRKRMKAMKER
jgi:hypothetical protein